MGTTLIKENIPHEVEGLIHQYTCDSCRSHIYNFKYLTQLARIMEIYIQENFRIPNNINTRRINFFQTVGEWMKYTGVTNITPDDSFSQVLNGVGVQMKRIGQMENEFACVINNTLLNNLQKCRLYHRLRIQPIINRLYKPCGLTRIYKGICSPIDRDVEHIQLHLNIDKFNQFYALIRPQLAIALRQLRAFGLYTKTTVETLLVEMKEPVSAPDVISEEKLECIKFNLTEKVYAMDKMTNAEVIDFLEAFEESLKPKASFKPLPPLQERRNSASFKHSIEEQKELAKSKNSKKSNDDDDTDDDVDDDDDDDDDDDEADDDDDVDDDEDDEDDDDDDEDEDEKQKNKNKKKKNVKK